MRPVWRYLAMGAALSGLLVGEVSLRKAAHDSSARAVHHGSAGVKHTQQGIDVRWRQGRTKVYLDASLDSLGHEARDAVTGAFATWSNADPELPGLEFERTQKAVLTAKPDGRNVVMVAPITVKGHEHDLAITLTYSDEQSGDIVEADIIVNSEYPFRTLDAKDDGYGSSDATSQQADKNATSDGTQLTVSSARASCTAVAQRASCEGNSYDLQNVLTHEVGHFFGLGEDMEDAAATMYYCTSRCETHKRVLTNSDSQVMMSLYSATPDSSAEPPGGCGGARMAPRGALREAGFALLFALATLARRRRSAANVG
jgi:hypothetical protein